MKTNKEPWWKRSVVYQIYPRSFMDSNGDGIGDLPGIISKLDYLQRLGVDVIWLSPVFDSPNDDNGYDIRDYRTILDEFGTMEDFDRLIQEADARGLRIVMDLVVNHTSDEHAWFVESKSSKDSKYRDYYIWKEGKNDQPPNNWGSVFSGSAWEKDEVTESYYLHLFSKKQPDLNWENKALRDDIYEMMTYWLDKGIGGFRMDVINFISKVEGLPDGKVNPGQAYGDGSPYFINGPKIHTHLKEMNERVLQNYDVLTVGEMPGATPKDAQLYTNPANKEVNMVFTFEHMDIDSGPFEKWDVKPLDLVALKQNFQKWQHALHEVGWNSLYWNNHDQPRIVSRFGNDQEFRVTSAKMLAICLHMLQGTPYIYQGEELGMTNVKFDRIEDYKDIETINMYNSKIEQGVLEKDIMRGIYAKGRDNARTPIQWTKDGGFTTGIPWIQMNPNTNEINVDQALDDKTSVFYTYQKLIELRKEHDIITYGSFHLLLPNNPSLFVYKRKTEKEEWLVITNFSDNTEKLEWTSCEVDGLDGKVIIANYDSQELGEQGMNVRPYEALVLAFERRL
ncbi:MULTISPECIES: glycoside hydrolase family 13 protein [Psychrobacillus]|uniref:oligo-1,6-glucosidase n=1 Tax=Psychrobacillus faecigallinarum TaxID=2762235 RepID=A0ABR8RCB0_9BACI|nr:alpha-glucosidase [Psychrobacillus faecigallinarum]MBD7945429.1 alpha-glucosidase [Psychrobacillus faecigallinarum]